MYRGGRKPKPPSQLRSKNINVALTVDEKEVFEAGAVSRGTTAPELIRRLMYKELGLKEMTKYDEPADGGDWLPWTT